MGPWDQWDHWEQWDHGTMWAGWLMGCRERRQGGCKRGGQAVQPPCRRRRQLPARVFQRLNKLGSDNKVPLRVAQHVNEVPVMVLGKYPKQVRFPN